MFRKRKKRPPLPKFVVIDLLPEVAAILRGGAGGTSNRARRHNLATALDKLREMLSGTMVLHWEIAVSNRKCILCGDPYVSDSHLSRYCSPTCSSVARGRRYRQRLAEQDGSATPEVENECRT